MKSFPAWRLGTIVSDKSFRVRGLQGKLIIDTTIDRLKTAWQGTFKGL